MFMINYEFQILVFWKRRDFSVCEAKTSQLIFALIFNTLSPVCFQSMQYSKVLIRDAERELLKKVNLEECNLLVERWQSNECMNAIMNFFQQKTGSKL